MISAPKISRDIWGLDYSVTPCIRGAGGGPRNWTKLNTCRGDSNNSTRVSITIEILKFKITPVALRYNLPRKVARFISINMVLIFYPTPPCLIKVCILHTTYLDLKIVARGQKLELNDLG